MELLKMLSANELVAQVICFLILLFLMKKFAWKPVLKVLDERKDKIESEFKEIDELKAEAEKMKDVYAARLSEIDELSKTRIEEAVREAEHMANMVKDSARKEADKITKDAHDMVKDEISKARELLKLEVVDLAISAAEKVIGEKMTDERDRKIVQGYITELEKGKNGR